jgi:hypothetical protein
MLNPIEASLGEVTIVSVTGIHVDDSHAALQRSLAGLPFRRALLIASEAPSHPDPRIEWIDIPPMSSVNEYSRFMLQDLHRYIETTHALIIQADGFVLNPERWNPAWLEFDYIGAPWGEHLRVGPYIIPLPNRVGNGGFSLRSRRLIDMVAPIDLTTLRYPTRAEDMIICHLLHDYLVERGMRFADLETAAAFSIENPKATFGQTLDTAFGFHGLRFLPEVRARDAAKARALVSET